MSLQPRLSLFDIPASQETVSVQTQDGDVVKDPAKASTMRDKPIANTSHTHSSVDLEALNPQQREAVMCTKGPLLVLAGAGSGKTRVLTQRIAYVIETEHIAPWQILAITFTNKAAKEMRERLEGILGGSMRGMWVCTFHAMCSRILREHAETLGYNANFSVYDDDDSKRIVKHIMEDLDIDPKKFSINSIRSRISAAKNAAKTWQDMEDESAQNPVLRACAQVYRELDIRLKRASAMDFDDLLLKTLELFSKHEDILRAYQDRFRYINVDEYQDTNGVQYALTNMLAQKYQNLMVVGDDDQSIYSWRGADITNILSFRKDYPSACVVKLEQNYRSYAHILNAANAVVKHNENREAKRLFTTRGEGDPIELFQAADERDEGRWIGSQIERLHDEGTSYNDIAVFYRTNAQSRILEDMFLRAGVPYSIVGGTRFFDRSEIRNVMAYLKVVVNPHDDVSLMRIINTPRRGIGATSLEKIQAHARDRQSSLFEAIEDICIASKIVSARVLTQLQKFISCIHEASRMSGDFGEVIQAIIESTHMIESLEAENTTEAEARIENIKEFYSVAAEFDESHDNIQETLLSLQQLREAGMLDGTPSDEKTSKNAKAMSDNNSHERQNETDAKNKNDTQLQLASFMEWLALRSDLDALSGQTSSITMMTVHAAKGLEFDNVFVAGMEDGMFPHQNFDKESSNIEEERRLAYVAITRARKRLFLSYAACRHMFGSVQTNPRSRFLNEIPEHDVHATGIGSEGFSGVGWEKRGDRHGTFGSGRGQEVYGGRVFGSYTRSTNKRAHTGVASTPSIQQDQVRAKTTFNPGDKVSHKVFGIGVVQSDAHDMVVVRFQKTGAVKKLMKGFAPIVKLDE